MNPSVSQRLCSLDIFRGLTIAAMILTNNPGSGKDGARFASLIHSAWHGCTPADFIFPFFVFIIGVSLVYSLGKRLEQARSLLPLSRYIFRRTGTLFFLGLFGWFACGWLFQSICPPAPTEKSMWAIFSNSPVDADAYFYSLDNLRFPGVLQRLALVYLIVATFNLHTGWRLQAFSAVSLLFLYWGLLNLPGFSLEPGADLGAYLDRALFGESHLFRQTWDPEGLLGTLPAAATGLMGGLTGHWLNSGREDRWKTLGLFLFGFMGIILGWVWGFIFPLNKNLWTSSFALYTAGWAMTILGALYWLFDRRKIRIDWVRPFLWLGQNPLLAYCLSQVGVMALDLLYIGTPSHHTSLLALIHNVLLGEGWDVMELTLWSDPRWPSLYWALLCLTSWTLLIGLFPRALNFTKVFFKQHLRTFIPTITNNFWHAKRIV